MDQYAYDSFAGPSLNLRPDELDRLDASQIDPEEPPSLAFDAEHYRKLENSINGTINALKARPLPYEHADYPAAHYERLEHREAAASPNFVSGPTQAFTPPSSQPHSSGDKPKAFAPYGKPGGPAAAPEKPPFGAAAAHDRPFGAATTYDRPFAPVPYENGQQSLIERMREERDRAVQEMQRLCDQRVEMVQRGEAERFKRLEEEYRKHLDSVKQDLDTMLRQHGQVTKVKNEVQKGLEVELETAKKDLRKERGMREADREKYQRTIRELKEEIRDLERKLADIRGHRRSRTVTFSQDADSFSEYERRLADIQRDNDSKIASLVRHFEKEKSSALEILKTKIRAEVSLLIPRIKEQCARVYSERLAHVKETLAQRFREQYEGQLRRMRDDHAVERRLWQRQLRDQIERERAEIAQKLRAKYELRILDVKNECERRILERLRGGRGNSDYSDSDLSFV